MPKELEAFNKLVNLKKFDRTTNSYRTFYDLCSRDEEELLDIIKSALERLEKLETENAKLKKLINIFLDWLYKNNCGEQAILIKEMLEEK